MWALGAVALALAGAITLLAPACTLTRALLQMVGPAAGSLPGGAFSHMLPGTIASTPP